MLQCRFKELKRKLDTHGDLLISWPITPNQCEAIEMVVDMYFGKVFAESGGRSNSSGHKSTLGAHCGIPAIVFTAPPRSSLALHRERKRENGVNEISARSNNSRNIIPPNGIIQVEVHAARTESVRKSYFMACCMAYQ